MIQGNCFCRWAQSVVSDVNAIAYGKLDRKMHEKGMNRAKALLQAAVQSYKQVDDFKALKDGNLWIVDGGWHS